jgi:hypothetical protein
MVGKKILTTRHRRLTEKDVAVYNIDNKNDKPKQRILQGRCRKMAKKLTKTEQEENEE